jgi:hypothetical protein
MRNEGGWFYLGQDFLTLSMVSMVTRCSDFAIDIRLILHPAMGDALQPRFAMPEERLECAYKDEEESA